MKTAIYIIISLLIPLSINGQIIFHDASSFPLLGKATQKTETRYERLPDSLKSITRPPVWELGQNSAGLAVRFRSNSTTIAARWELLLNRNMNHMTATGTKGLDLYCLEDGQWRFVNSGRPAGKKNEAVIISNMQPKEREYMLYLSLYDGVTALSIGIDSLAHISQPEINAPIREKPIVFYGTSILQGGCASRPGMAHTNILSRWLNREVINLGFSGNGKLDYEIAEVIANVDASLYVLDFVPNASPAEIREKTEHFYAIIRDKHPDTPILFVEDPLFTHSLFDQRIAKEIKEKNIAINQVVNLLKERGDRNITLISSENMIGTDGEATIDGIHFTDLGFMRYAELLHPIIKKQLPICCP
jgi:hypothetical protein